jgi:hypothetical protein
MRTKFPASTLSIYRVVTFFYGLDAWWETSAALSWSTATDPGHSRALDLLQPDLLPAGPLKASVVFATLWLLEDTKHIDAGIAKNLEWN